MKLHKHLKEYQKEMGVFWGNHDHGKGLFSDINGIALH